MEKLRPLITHNYWIVFVLALILPTVGWWIDTASVNDKTEKAISKANNAFKDVPPPDSPNGSWATAIRDKINVPLEEDYNKFNSYLWKTQQKEMTWPSSINAYMQEIPFLSKIDTDKRRSYRKAYFQELDAAWKSVDPLTPEMPNGKVFFDLSSFTPQVDLDQWPESPPDSKEMWEVQQDIWLLRALLSAIEKVNHEFDSHLQAPINTILAIELRGGNPDALNSSSNETLDQAAGLGEGPMAKMGAMGAMAGGSPEGFRGAAGGNGGSQAGIEIDLAKLFGPDTIENTVSDAAGTVKASAAGPGAGPGAFSALRGGGRQQNRRRRYVDDKEGAPFKTRGFSLTLIMDHSRLPDLMIQLSNLEWPVQIVLVQQQSVNPENLAGLGKGSMGSMGAMGAMGAMGSMANRPRTGGRRAGRMGSSGMGNMTGMGRAGMGRAGMGRAGMGKYGGRGGSQRRPTLRMNNQRPAAAPMRQNINRGDRDRTYDISGMMSAAGLKTNLATVTIAGKLTLFQPPPEEEGALAAAEAVEIEKLETSETTDPSGTKPTDSPAGTEQAADTPAADPSATGPPASTDQPDSKAPAKEGTGDPPSGGTTNKQSPPPDGTNSPQPKPSATETTETDDSTTSSKEDRPE